MKFLEQATAVAGIFLAGSGLFASAAAQTAEEFYKGKQLKVIVGQPAGDRGDVIARIVSKYMSRHIPGNPVIVPQNMPGAGTFTALGYLYDVAPRDGTVFGTFSRSAPVQAVMGTATVQFDPRPMGWIGSPETVEQLCVANASSPIVKPEDLFTTELIVGGSGPGVVTVYLPKVLQTTIGMKFRIITGYKGAADTFLAMERGELQGICTVLDQIMGSQPRWIPDGKVRVLFHTSPTASPSLPGIPSVYNYVKSEEHRQLIHLVNSGVEFGRPFATPPHVPADRLRILRRAFSDALKDPEFLAEAKKIDLDVGYITGETMDTLVSDLYAVPQALVERANALMAGTDK